MSPGRWHPFVIAALSIASASSGFANAPRLDGAAIPSSPSADVVTPAQPLGELRFTLDPRIGFFAAGDPINQMDPDGRYGKQAIAQAGAFIGTQAANLQNWLSPVTPGFTRQEAYDFAVQHHEEFGVDHPDQWLSDAWDMVPVAGAYKGLMEAAGGVNWATGEEVNPFERTFSAALNIASIGIPEGRAAAPGARIAATGARMEVGASGALAAKMPLFSETAGAAMDSAQFSRIQSAFQRRGLMQADAESTRLLQALGAEGATLDASTIILRQNPSRSAVFEELIHSAQLRRGMTDVTTMEVEAAEKLIRSRLRYGIPNSETRQTIERLRQIRGVQ